jgi:hypothetical protein
MKNSIRMLVYAEACDNPQARMWSILYKACGYTYPKKVTDSLREPIWNAMSHGGWRPVRVCARYIKMKSEKIKDSVCYNIRRAIENRIINKLLVRYNVQVNMTDTWMCIKLRNNVSSVFYNVFSVNIERNVNENKY